MKDSINDYLELVAPIIYILILIVCIIAAGKMVVDTYNFTEKVAIEVNSNIGSKVVLDNDTLTVIDHSYWSSTYTLSNNAEISSMLIDSLKLKSNLLKK